MSQRDEVAEAGREPVQDREEHARVRRRSCWSESQLWKLLRSGGASSTRAPPATGTAALPGEVGDHHPDDDEDRRGRAVPPPGRAAAATRETRCGSRRPSVARSPAIAVEDGDRSTTPTTRPSSTAQTGRSLAAITGTASRTVVATSSLGPSSSPGARRRA